MIKDCYNCTTANLPDFECRWCSKAGLCSDKDGDSNHDVWYEQCEANYKEVSIRQAMTWGTKLTNIRYSVGFGIRIPNTEPNLVFDDSVSLIGSIFSDSILELGLSW